MCILSLVFENNSGDGLNPMVTTLEVHKPHNITENFFFGKFSREARKVDLLKVYIHNTNLLFNRY